MMHGPTNVKFAPICF